MRTSTAEKHGYVCPKCHDEMAQDHAGQGFVKHKTNKKVRLRKGYEGSAQSGRTPQLTSKSVTASPRNLPIFRWAPGSGARCYG